MGRPVCRGEGPNQMAGGRGDKRPLVTPGELDLAGPSSRRGDADRARRRRGRGGWVRQGEGPQVGGDVVEAVSIRR
jgi:hypothetical protein